MSLLLLALAPADAAESETAHQTFVVHVPPSISVAHRVGTRDRTELTVQSTLNVLVDVRSTDGKTERRRNTRLVKGIRKTVKWSGEPALRTIIPSQTVGVVRISDHAVAGSLVVVTVVPLD